MKYYRIGTLAAALALLGAGLPSAADLRNGIWAGTLQLGKSPAQYFTVAFPQADAADDPGGDLYFPLQSESAIAFTSFRRDGSSVRFTAASGPPKYTFTGRVDGMNLRGTVSKGSQHGTFVLTHIIRLSDEELEPYVGTYRAPDREIMIARPYTYIMFLDRKTGRMGFLWPSGKDTFFSGPSKGIHYPAVITARFRRDAMNAVDGVSISYPDGAPIDAKREPAFATRTLDFENSGAHLRGTIAFPHAKPPYPAVMLLAGSNYQTRAAQNAFLAWAGDTFLRHGYAVYAYDKRGADQSTGARDDSFVVRDAIRGFETLRHQPEVNAKCLGIWGVSQGGMAAPEVAAAVGDVAFIVNTSGAIVNGNLQETERTALEMRADGFSETDIQHAVDLQTLKFNYAMTGQGWDAYAAALQKYKDAAWFPDPYVGPPTDPKDKAFAFWRAGGAHAPADFWAKYHGAVLFIDGEHETNEDPRVNMAAFADAMRQAGNSNYTTIVVPGADHSMLVDPRGGNTIDRLLTHYEMAYFDDLAQWIERLPCTRH